MRVEPVVLEGSVVRLEPIEARHAAELSRNCPIDVFRYFLTDRAFSQDEDGYLALVERLRARTNMLPFATVLRETGEAIGGTTYMDIRPEHRGLEIGTTWIAPQYQGTKVNPEAKLLMLTHAFEDLGCERVQLKCDARNEQSAAAIRKLGAVFEGRLRKHMVLPDGFVRDTLMFSIVRDEWPAVRAGLEARLKG